MEGSCCMESIPVVSAFKTFLTQYVLSHDAIDCIDQHIFHFDKDHILGNLVIGETIHLNQLPHLKINKRIGFRYALFE